MKTLNTIFALCLLAVTGFTQTKPINLETGTDPHPQLTNAKIQTVDASAGLEKTVDGIIKQQTVALWIGYMVPTERKERTMCCSDNWDGGDAGSRCCSGCKLESSNNNFINGRNDGANCNLEPTDYAFIFLRAEGGKITKSRAFSRDCSLDAAGLNVYWLNRVNTTESVHLLVQLVQSEINAAERHFAGQALYSIAIHKDPSADAALENFLAQSMPRNIRQNAALMLGAERGERGLEILRRAFQADSDDRFREQALIGFAQSENQAGLKDLLEIAKTDSSPRVRGQAIFWLAQAGSRKEAAAITDAIENDPDTQVKKRAVFALTQMPNDEGVPLLIHVAKTNKNPVVRKQAIFWLGQSKDPRGLQFLEEILFGPKPN